MSRLGDLIRLERTRQGMTFKQVAKKCGVSEGYLLAVEAGTRIIADDQARRILRIASNMLSPSFYNLYHTPDGRIMQAETAKTPKRRPAG